MGHDRGFQRHRFEQGPAESFPSRWHHEDIGPREQVRNVVTDTEEPNAPREPERGHDGIEGGRRVALSTCQDEESVGSGAEDLGEGSKEKVQALLIFVPRRGQHEGGSVIDPQLCPDHPPSLCRAGPQPVLVTAAWDDVDPVAGDAEPLGHHVRNEGRKSVKTRHPPGGQGVRHLGGTELGSAKARIGAVARAIGVVDEARDGGDSGDPRRYAPNHVGSKERRVNELRLAVQDQGSCPPHPAGLPSSPSEAEHLDPERLELTADPVSPLVEVGNLELDPS